MKRKVSQNKKPVNIESQPNPHLNLKEGNALLKQQHQQELSQTQSSGKLVGVTQPIISLSQQPPQYQNQLSDFLVVNNIAFLPNGQQYEAVIHMVKTEGEQTHSGIKTDTHTKRNTQLSPPSKYQLPTNTSPLLKQRLTSSPLSKFIQDKFLEYQQRTFSVHRSDGSTQSSSLSPPKNSPNQNHNSTSTLDSPDPQQNKPSLNNRTKLTNSSTHTVATPKPKQGKLMNQQINQSRSQNSIKQNNHQNPKQSQQQSSQQMHHNQLKQQSQSHQLPQQKIITVPQQLEAPKQKKQYQNGIKPANVSFQNQINPSSNNNHSLLNESQLPQQNQQAKLNSTFSESSPEKKEPRTPRTFQSTFENRWRLKDIKDVEAKLIQQRELNDISNISPERKHPALHSNKNQRTKDVSQKILIPQNQLKVVPSLNLQSNNQQKHQQASTNESNNNTARFSSGKPPQQLSQRSQQRSDYGSEEADVSKQSQLNNSRQKENQQWQLSQQYSQQQSHEEANSTMQISRSDASFNNRASSLSSQSNGNLQKTSTMMKSSLFSLNDRSESPVAFGKASGKPYATGQYNIQNESRGMARSNSNFAQSSAHTDSSQKQQVVSHQNSIVMKSGVESRRQGTITTATTATVPDNDDEYFSFTSQSLNQNNSNSSPEKYTMNGSSISMRNGDMTNEDGQRNQMKDYGINSVTSLCSYELIHYYRFLAEKAKQDNYHKIRVKYSAKS